jgi:sulfur-carrier protein
MNAKQATIELKLFATLARFTPANAAQYPIQQGVTVGQLLMQFPFAADEAKLIFVNGVKKDLQTRLNGGERVGVFPPVGGG